MVTPSPSSEMIPLELPLSVLLSIEIVAWPHAKWQARLKIPAPMLSVIELLVI